MRAGSPYVILCGSHGPQTRQTVCWKLWTFHPMFDRQRRSRMSQLYSFSAKVVDPIRRIAEYRGRTSSLAASLLFPSCPSARIVMDIAEDDRPACVQERHPCVIGLSGADRGLIAIEQ